jgi:hypothetical protein
MTAKLINISLPNVEVASKELAAGVDAYKLADALVPVAVKIAMTKIDKWRVVAFGHKDTSVSESGLRIRTLGKIAIIEDGGKLGTIDLSQRWGRSRGSEGTYRVHSDRITGRKNYKETTNPKIAIKTAFEAFLAKSPKEILLDANSTILSSLNSQEYAARRAIEVKFSNIEEAAVEFVLNRMEEFEQEHASHKVHVDELLEARCNHDVIKSVALIKSVLISVVLTDTDMLVEQDNVVTRWTNGGELAPEHIRRKVGLLKLVQDSQVIRDVGIRVDAHTFGVTPEVTQ